MLLTKCKLGPSHTTRQAQDAPCHTRRTLPPATLPGSPNVAFHQVRGHLISPTARSHKLDTALRHPRRLNILYNIQC
uniref:Uncharacterized protein n=1 Tax=Ralstonia syzygii R24 TaxID=907261 RepID=G2ZZA1_9RALS|nr:hypothetical protein RALSY_10158 [Ralstonia syzygii R24]